MKVLKAIRMPVLTCLFVFLVLLATGTAHADGIIVGVESVNLQIPYQRALILFREGKETLILQSKYEALKNPGNTLGWVVPVPAVPEVASMKEEDAYNMFRILDRITCPTFTNMETVVFLVLVLGLFFLSLIPLLMCLLSLFLPFLSWTRNNRGKLVRFSLSALSICVLVFLLGPGLFKAGKFSGVETIGEYHVGIYDVRIIKSKDSLELIQWLNANKFTFTEKNKSAFDEYIKQGWCFVVAQVKVNAEKAHEESSVVLSEGLIAPLILRFQHEIPVYPLALTATGGQETEVLIYLAAKNKMSCGDRLQLQYAGHSGLSYDLGSSIQTNVEPKGFFKPEDLSSLPYLCKFKGILTPSQMKEDISFVPASDNRFYREHIIRW